MRLSIAAIVLLGLAVSSSAQSVTGSADWSYGRASFDGDRDTATTTTTAQSYSVGYESTLWDPRFLRYSGTLTWQRIGLNRDGSRSASRQLGFRALGAFFPSRPFPVTLQASRGTGGESGDFPGSNPVRGGLEVVPSELTRDLNTRTSQFGLTSQWLPKRGPRFDGHYQRAGAAMSLGSAAAEQHDSTLAVNLAHDGRRARTTLRYNRTRTDNFVNRLFSQRFSELACNVSSDLWSRTRAELRAGYRDTFSLTDLAPAFVDLGRELHRPPAAGRSSLAYGTASLQYQSRRRLTTSVSASLDRHDAASGAATGLLATSDARYLLLDGLSLQASGNYGTRGQVVPGQRVDVSTRGASAGANWRIPVRLLPLSLGYSETWGWHEEASGRTGETRGRQAHLAASASPWDWIELGGRLERARAEDDLLPFGNYSADRARATARLRVNARLSVEGNWERADGDRGFGPSFSTNRLLNSGGSAHYALTRASRVSVHAGRSFSQTDGGSDVNRYVGGAYEGLLTRHLHVALTARREHVALGRSALLRDGWFATGRLEYRLTLLTFALDYRLTDLRIDTGSRSEVVEFSGNQLLVRVSRRFIFRP